MFTGEYDSTIDDKNRVVLPSAFREAIDAAKEADKLYLSYVPDGCITICTESEWQRCLEQLDAKPFAPEQMRRFRRHLSSMTQQGKYDKQGRLVLPPKLLQESKIEREVCIVGNLRVIEVWAKNIRDQRRAEDAGSFGKFMTELFG